MSDFEEGLDFSSIYFRLDRGFKLATVIAKKLVAYWEKMGSIASEWWNKEDPSGEAAMLEGGDWLDTENRDFKLITLEHCAYLTEKCDIGKFYNFLSCEGKIRKIN